MEYAQTELKLLAEVSATVESPMIQELTDTQLALIGGGVGEITPY